MWRVVMDDVILFLAPFAVFAAFLLFRGQRVLDPGNWREKTSWLAIAGAALVLGGLVVQFLLAPSEFGAYAPARLENGRLVPGEIVPRAPMAPRPPTP